MAATPTDLYAFGGKSDRVEILRKELYGRDRDVALHYAKLLKFEDLEKLFAGLIHIARSVHGPFNAAWDIIKSMPRDWILANIEKEADAILAHEEEDDYWMFLNLYDQLDSGLAKKLAIRASQHGNPAIQEPGQEFLEKLAHKIVSV